MFCIVFSLCYNRFVHAIYGNDAGFGSFDNAVDRLLKLLHFRQACRASTQMRRERLTKLGILIIGRIDSVGQGVIINIAGRDRFTGNRVLVYCVVRQLPEKPFAISKKFFPAAGACG